MAVPSAHMREAAAALAAHLARDGRPAVRGQGHRGRYALRMTEVIARSRRDRRGRVAALSGPNLAPEIARGLPASAVGAADDVALATRVAEGLGQPPTSGSTGNRDVVGVELGGALKNIVAIAAGAVDQLGFGDNGKAGLMTRGLAEITRLGVAAGANPLTFAGLAGIGDIVATCSSPLSRNHRLGMELAAAARWAEIEATLPGVAEGAYTVDSALALADRLGVDLPIAREVHLALYEGKRVRRCLIDLLARESKDELADYAAGPARRRWPSGRPIATAVELVRLGAWRSLVAHLNGVQEVERSNRSAPTTLLSTKWPPGSSRRAFRFGAVPHAVPLRDLGPAEDLSMRSAARSDRRRQMRVHVGGGRDRRVPERSGHDGQLLAVLEHQGRVGVSQMVERLPGEAGSLESCLERLGDVRESSASPIRAREHVAVVRPSRPAMPLSTLRSERRDAVAAPSRRVRRPVRSSARRGPGLPDLECVGRSASRHRSRRPTSGGRATRPAGAREATAWRRGGPERSAAVGLKTSLARLVGRQADGARPDLSPAARPGSPRCASLGLLTARPRAIRRTA